MEIDYAFDTHSTQFHAASSMVLDLHSINACPSSSAFQAQSQYVLTTQQLQGGGGTVRQTAAAAAQKHSASAALSCRPHITLNPYSTQLVDNLNMMMPTTPAERAAAAASHSMTMQPKLLGLTNSLKGGTQQRHFQQQQDE